MWEWKEHSGNRKDPKRWTSPPVNSNGDFYTLKENKTSIQILLTLGKYPSRAIQVGWVHRQGADEDVLGKAQALARHYCDNRQKQEAEEQDGR